MDNISFLTFTLAYKWFLMDHLMLAVVACSIVTASATFKIGSFISMSTEYSVCILTYITY